MYFVQKEAADSAEPNKKKRKKKEKEKKGETVVATGFTVLGEELSTKKKKVGWSGVYIFRKNHPPPRTPTDLQLVVLILFIMLCT